MKKIIQVLAISLLLISILLATACATKDSNPDNSKTKPAESTDPANLVPNENTTSWVQLGGSILVTVQDLVNNLAVTDEKPLVALVFEYQSSPYLLKMTEEQIAKLEKGKHYVITFKDMTLSRELEKAYWAYPIFFNELRNDQKVALFALDIEKIELTDEEPGMDNDRMIRFTVTP